MNYYKKLNQDQTQEHTKIINNTIETFQRQRVLSENIIDNLKTTKVRTPQFYVTPKIHTKDLSGRPVVSSIDCHTSKITKFVDHYQQPHTKALPSYLQDTTDFINKI